MNNQTAHHANQPALTLQGLPLPLRLIRMTGLPPLPGVGLMFAALVGALIAGQFLLPIEVSEYRMVETLIALLMLAILSYVLFSTSRLLSRPGVQDAINANPRRHLAICLGLCLFAALLPLVEQAEHEYFPYNATLWSWEVSWHRILTLLIGWYSGVMAHAMFVSGQLLNRHIEQMDQFDLFDHRAAQPAIQQGLANALLVLGIVAIVSPFLVDPRYYVMIGFVVVLTAILSGTALLLPMRGYKMRAAREKQIELDRILHALASARANLWHTPNDAEQAQLVAALSRYRQDVEAVREWPFDRSTFAKYGLYLLLPVGSWFGGAIVERLLDGSF